MSDRAKAARKARRRGHSAEMKTWQRLTEMGYIVILGRAGKTRSDCVDGVAIGKNHIIVFQSKAYEISRGDREVLQERFDALAHLPGISYLLWTWDGDFVAIKDMT